MPLDACRKYSQFYNKWRKPVGNEEFSLPTGLSVFYL